MTITQLNNELNDMGFTDVEIEIKMFMGLPWLYILVSKDSCAIKLDVSVATLEKYGVVKIAFGIDKEWHKQRLKN